MKSIVVQEALFWHPGILQSTTAFYVVAECTTKGCVADAWALLGTPIH